MSRIIDFVTAELKTTKTIDQYELSKFRIIKNGSKYDLWQLIPANLMNGRAEWGMIRKNFESHSEAKNHAYNITEFNDDNIVEEFII